MPSGPLAIVGIGNSVTAPLVVILPILFPVRSVNQRFPSGPTAIPIGKLLAPAENSVTPPVVVILPILFARYSTNHRFPSGPAVMSKGPLFAVGIGKSATAPPVVILPS